MTTLSHPQSVHPQSVHPRIADPRSERRALRPAGPPAGSWNGGRPRSPSVQVLPSRLLILLVALASVFLLFSTRVSADGPPVVAEYVVAGGDTLWSIAGSLAEPDEDVRRVVAELRDLNDLEGGMLRTGQVLVVPGG